MVLKGGLKFIGLTDHPVEELVVGLSLYDAVVELRWRRKYPPKGEGYVYHGIFSNRAKVYKEERPLKFAR